MSWGALSNDDALPGLRGGYTLTIGASVTAHATPDEVTRAILTARGRR